MTFPLDFKWPLARTLVCAFVAGLLFLGTRGLYQTTEGRYAECARQMMVSGHWLDPVLNGRPHWTKPPLTYLAIMGPMSVAGVNTWTARAYLLPCLLLAISGVWLLGRHLGNDPRLGDLSALVFATSVFPLAANSVISTDYPLATFLILAQAFFWRAIRTSSRTSVYWVWAWLGVAFVTKGPPSLLVLPAMIITWRLLPVAQRKAVPLFSPGALVLYFVIASTWYVWEALRHPGLLQYWIRDEVINRSATDEFNRNPQFYRNFDLYLPVLLFGCWPWGGWLFFLRRKAWGAWLATCFVRTPEGKVSRWPALTAQVKQWPLEKRWAVLALGLPLLVFFLSRSKLPLYVLPLFGPLSVFIASGLLRVFERDTARLWKKATVLACVFWTLSVAGKGALSFFPGGRDMKVLYVSVLKQVKHVQADRLAVFEKKELNGLQFYLQTELRHFDSVDTPEFQQWLARAGSGEKYLLLRPGHTNTLAKSVLPARAEFSTLTDKWMLARVPVAP
ncbi:MAG: glycosyltransferase family 39 protein [bacterium]